MKSRSHRGAARSSTRRRRSALDAARRLCTGPALALPIRKFFLRRSASGMRSTLVVKICTLRNPVGAPPKPWLHDLAHRSGPLKPDESATRAAPDGAILVEDERHEVSFAARCAAVVQVVHALTVAARWAG